MDGISDFKQEYYKNNYLFDPSPFGRIYVFVDFANVRQWAKSFWREENKKFLIKEIDISKLGELIGYIKPTKSFFYYGIYPKRPDLSDRHQENIRHRKSQYRISKAQQSGFITRQKDIKEIKEFDEDGKFAGTIKKCNFDIEIAMDMLQKVNKYDTIFFWSGDSDFHKLFNHLCKKENKKVIIACVRDFMSKELDDVADLYVPADPFKDFLLFNNEHSPHKGGEA